MKRFMTIISVLAVLSMAGSAFAEYEYGWTVSNSVTDPLSNTGAPGSGSVVSFYLWFYCSTTEGMSAAEFDAVGTGINVLAFTPMNGYLNAGGATNLLLAVGSCPAGPVVAGNWLCLDLPGTLCLEPSAANGFNVTVDCRANPEAHVNTVRGYSSIGEPCGNLVSELCEVVVSVEDESWGSIKSLYR